MSRVALVAALSMLWACSSRGLSNEELTAVVEARRGSLNACYESALVERPVKLSLEGKAYLVIAPSGEVSAVHLEGDLDPLPGLADCLRSAISDWEFPSAGAKTQTTLPLVFEPQVVQAAGVEAP